MINVDVAQNLHEVLGNLPDGVRLVAISKYHLSWQPIMLDKESLAKVMSKS